MFKYLDLCVELKKSHIAKEGLFQYRNMFQSVNVGSLENVIRGYLRMAEEKTENAREQSAQAVIDIDDLDNLATPESILLRYTRPMRKTRRKLIHNSITVPFPARTPKIAPIVRF